MPHKGVEHPEFEGYTPEQLQLGGSGAKLTVAHSDHAHEGGGNHDELTGVSADDHHPQIHGHTGADGSGTVAHSATTGRGTDDHHAKVHDLGGADHTGTITDAKHGERTKTNAHRHSDLSLVSANQHHNQSHNHGGTDGSGTVAHSSTTGRGANDHHAQIHAVSHGQAGGDKTVELQVMWDATTIVAVGGSSTAIESVTITLPTGWGAMDIEVFAYGRNRETAAGEARSDVWLESPNGTILGRAITLSMHATGSNMSNAYFVGGILQNIGASRQLVLRMIQTAGTVDAVDRYCWVRKTRRS